jgi:putative transposase
MLPVDPPFKTCVRFNEAGHAHALTFSCGDRRPLFDSDRLKELFIESLAAARQQKGFDLWAYCIMPEHVHLLLWPRERPYSISAILYAIKRPASFRAGEEGLCPRQSLWLPGGGFDRNLDNVPAVHAEIEYMHGNPVRRGLCARPTDWKYSSARFWAGLDDVVLDMDRTVPALSR